MARGRKHDDQTRAAIMGALLAGQSISEISKQHKLSTSVVYGLKKELGEEKLENVRNKKADEFGELLADFLRETIITLKAQVQFFRNESWLKQQEAAQVATLFGVTTDKAIRLLEAAQASESTDQQPQPS